MNDDSKPIDLEDYRSYLMVLAESNMDSRLRSKLDPADIVQQTLIRAHQAVSELRSRDKAAVPAWLRTKIPHYFRTTMSRIACR